MLSARVMGAAPLACRRVCEFIYSHLDVRGLAEPKAEALLLLLAAGSGNKARLQCKAGATRSDYVGGAQVLNVRRVCS